MKFETTPTFMADWKRLDREHRAMFMTVLPQFNAACEAFASEEGQFRWPARLRVAPMRGAPGVWEMTWSFARPDGRATFEFVTVDDGIAVRWRRIGTHQVFGRP